MENLSALIDDFNKCNHVVETHEGFAVYRIRDDIGKLVASRIPDIDTANEIALLPRLKALAQDAIGLVDELRANEVIPEDDTTGSWGWEADELLKQHEYWNRPPVLASGDDQTSDSDAFFQDVGDALEKLPIDLVSKRPKRGRD